MVLSTYLVYSIVVSLLSIFTGWGCSRGIPEISQPQQQPELEKTTQPISTFRFGAVYYPYADIYAQPDAASKRLTQCTYGDVVRIVEETRWWYSVKIGPYPELSGWIHKSGVTVLAANALYLKERSLKTIVIRQDVSQVFIWPSHSLSIGMGTELPFIGETEAWYLVRLPTNDIGRIAKDSAYLSVMFQPLIQVKQEPVLIPENQNDISHQRHDIVTTARRFLGKTYIWGGTTPHGFDCSGLSYFVYKLNGIELPRVSWLQFQTNVGKQIKQSQLVYGDLVFFQTYRRGPSHVGIYIGNNQFIHASPSSGVTTSTLDEPYFRKRYVGAKTLFSQS
jgi:hypothetical protein